MIYNLCRYLQFIRFEKSKTNKQTKNCLNNIFMGRGDRSFSTVEFT